jgi:biopolymer transport protein ExbD
VKANPMMTEDRPIAGVNIVPVIDLCLVLLIIMMVTSPLLDTADLPVKLPQATTIESKEKNVAVTYAPDGRLAVNSTVVANADEFIPTLRSVLRPDPNILVILRVDRGAPYLTLTDLIERCKKAGAQNISIGTEQKKVTG